MNDNTIQAFAHNVCIDYGACQNIYLGLSCLFADGPVKRISGPRFMYSHRFHA